MNSKTLKQIVLGTMLLSQGTIDCDLSERNLITQYIIVEDNGKGTLHRVYLDKSVPDKTKRCKVEYDITGIEPRGSRYLMILGEGRYYVDQ